MLGFWIGVLGNLVAAVICGVPAYIHHHRRSEQRHAEVMAALSDADRQPNRRPE